MAIATIQSTLSTRPLRKVLAFSTGFGLSMLSYTVDAEPTNGCDSVQGLYKPPLADTHNLTGKSLRAVRLCVDG